MNPFFHALLMQGPDSTPAPNNDMPTFSRRGFLHCAALGTLGAGAVFSGLSPVLAAEPRRASSLILYFSRTGHTRSIAEHIHSRVGGDLIELKTAVPYPADYDVLVAQAQREQKNNARPALATELPALDAYHTVFIGFPNWWSSMPMLFFTLWEKYTLGSKTLIPFCTHGGGRFGHSLQDLKRLCPQARIEKGFEVAGTRAARAQNEVDAWLRTLDV